MIATPLRLALAVVWPLATVAVAAERVDHELTVRLEPSSGRLEVADTIRLGPRPAGASGSLDFLLNARLALLSSDPPAERVGEEPAGTRPPLNGTTAAATPGAPLVRYRLTRMPPDGVVRLRYAGSFDFGLSDPREEYTRGFRQTAGIVGTEGVYLDGAGYWVPAFDDGLVTFRLDVALPEGWRAVSQGRGTSRDNRGHALWDSAEPMDDVYLVAGPWVEYRDLAGAIETLVFLREPDRALATKYLGATAQYLEMYRDLIGPYPYAKFALVENFWETGYGMPSFTLLGPRVIRFPFILHSSYPHEILHNWWGNSVFVAAASGNWCEGLTAYLADHLVQEQRGRGDAYRRDTLQKYRDYTREQRDFPLAEFRERHSSATEAVGYGKALMLFHMMRLRLGDEPFRAALAGFYEEQRGQRAGFGDLSAVFARAGGDALGAAFDTWVGRAGAPRLQVADARAIHDDGVWRITARIGQAQDDPPFPLDVPFVVDDAEGGSLDGTVRLDGRVAEIEVRSDVRPVALRVDPRFDLFRILDPRETPPTLGTIFGEPRILAVVPAGAAGEPYRELAASWASESHAVDVVADDALDAIPADRSVWILGRANRLAEALFGAGAVEGFALRADGYELGAETVPLPEHSLVVTRRHPAASDRAVGWIVADPSAALPGLGRKLPHYGKYSYLAFVGDEPDNVVKGQWPASGSPLVVDLRPAPARAQPLVLPDLAPRAALAELPPVFSSVRMMEHVGVLAADSMEGRGAGSAGLERAADYVAEQFAAAGLAPAGEEGGWFQRFTLDPGPGGRSVEQRNVVGRLAGSDPARAGQAILVGAHYDHLGRGWPDVREGEAGRIHPGADDNASGVAVLIELARHFAAAEPPLRDLLFVAFAGEEAGRAGSRHYAQHPLPHPLAGIRAVVNLDTVGRRNGRPIDVLGAGTADEWPHIVRGVGFVTGVEARAVSGAAEGSDQQSFIERGIPAVQLFTGAHEDYHRPADRVEHVDAAGLVQVATFAQETLGYLLERDEPLTATLAGDSAAAAPPSASGRRVSFGIVPDFAFAGPGARAESIVAGSPAAAAGLRAGDVLLALDGRDIADLRGFSQALRELQPGRTVRARLARDGEIIELDVTLEAR